MAHSFEADPELYAANLAVLRGKYPKLAERLTAAKDSVPAASDPSLVGEGKPAASEDPWAEVAVHLETVPPGATSLVVFLGIGMGCGPLLIQRERPDLSMMVVIEPDLAMWQTAMRVNDLRPLIAAANVFFIHEFEPSSFERLVGRAAAVEDIHILRYPPSFVRHPELYEPLDHEVYMLLNRLNAGGATTVNAGETFFRNRAANLAMLRQCLSTDALAGLFSGKPAVLVAAGPSLNESLPELRRLVGHCVMIAADSAVAPLLAAGVVPDFVTSIDYQTVNFQKLAPFCAEEQPFSLVATVKAAPEMLRRVPARRRFLAFQEDSCQQWICDALGVRHLLPNAFSVAHLSLGLARLMGADPVIFVGQDLSFTGVDNDHATGTILHGNGPDGSLEMFDVPALDGGTVVTDRQLLSLIRVFEENIAADPCQYYNATARGAVIAGAERRTLVDLEKEGVFQPLAVEEAVAEAVRKTAGFAVDGLLAALQGEIRAMDNARQMARRSLKLGRQLLEMLQGQRAVDGLEGLARPVVKKLKSFDRYNNKLDALNYIWYNLLELTANMLADNDRWRARNEKVLQDDGYVPWLVSEISRIISVNKGRESALSLALSCYGQVCVALCPKDEEGDIVGALDRDDAVALWRCAGTSGLPAELRRLLTSLALAVSRPVEGWVGEEVAAASLPVAMRQAVEGYCQRFVEGFAAMVGRHGRLYAEEDERVGLFPGMLSRWLHQLAFFVGREEELPVHIMDLWRHWYLEGRRALREGEISRAEHVVAVWAPLTTVLPAADIFAAEVAVRRGGKRPPAKTVSPSPASLAALAMYRIACGEYDDGLRKLAEAVAAERGWAVLWGELGEMLLEGGDTTGAVAAFERAFVALPEDVGYLVRIGDCYLRAGQRQAAEAAYGAARERDPENKELERRIQRHRQEDRPSGPIAEKCSSLRRA